MAADVMRFQGGSGWRGTFGMAVAFVAQNLLTDGEPVKDVRVETHEGVTTGDLTAADDNSVTVVSGLAAVVIDIEEIDVFEVSC
jgi:hypothetical protein